MARVLAIEIESKVDLKGLLRGLGFKVQVSFL
jgi:hypothetical protein